MSADRVEIRRLVQGDAADVALDRSIQLEALRDHSEAFGSTYTLEYAQPSSWFSDRLGASTVLGAFRHPELVGMAGFAIQQGPKRAHKGLLWGMYVRPAARTAGIGRRLIEAIFEVARGQVELIQLTVVRNNERARKLYDSLGSSSTAWRGTPSSRTAATTTRCSWLKTSWHRMIKRDRCRKGWPLAAAAGTPIDLSGAPVAAARRAPRPRRDGRRPG
jgi:ribosomal protein S18 acetylase RimI-like enzyme